MNKEKKNWENEFDKRACIRTDENGSQDFYTVDAPKNHLLIDFNGKPENYPESTYELDPEKVKDFIRQEKKNTAKECMEVVEEAINETGCICGTLPCKCAVLRVNIKHALQSFIDEL